MSSNSKQQINSYFSENKIFCLERQSQLFRQTRKKKYSQETKSELTLADILGIVCDRKILPGRRLMIIFKINHSDISSIHSEFFQKFICGQPSRLRFFYCLYFCELITKLVLLQLWPKLIFQITRFYQPIQML
ncbi:unnamed protein product [Paramecium octaurelia]|uniref:Transmembrane protein n=1 Tax=Paramecium octaurelia TaxID=43137 RepID=A0A8S1X1Q2_PAROT|nr:unnamed protein product [Paramecium octaurelia]